MTLRALLRALVRPSPRRRSALPAGGDRCAVAGPPRVPRPQLEPAPTEHRRERAHLLHDRRPRQISNPRPSGRRPDRPCCRGRRRLPGWRCTCGRRALRLAPAAAAGCCATSAGACSAATSRPITNEVVVSQHQPVQPSSSPLRLSLAKPDQPVRPVLGVQFGLSWLSLPPTDCEPARLRRIRRSRRVNSARSRSASALRPAFW